MNIGMVDLDRKNDKHPFPNLALMKLSAFHKSNGDSVEWLNTHTHYNKVYVSKVFSFSPDLTEEIDSEEVVFGGSGFAIHLENGIEIYDKSKDEPLPYEIEHIFPDYSLYGITDTAYGFLSKGCPRKCQFCHVKTMQSTKAERVATLDEFWNGQKNIVLLDPNITALKDWKSVFQELIDSKARIDFSQGLDIRLMTAEKAEYIKRMKIKGLHFAYDRYEDKPFIEPKLKEFSEITGWKNHQVVVYVLVNFDTTLEQDLERVMFIRSLGMQPYIMRYNKESIPRGSMINALARWVNFIPLFWKYQTFEEYLKNERK